MHCVGVYLEGTVLFNLPRGTVHLSFLYLCNLTMPTAYVVHMQYSTIVCAPQYSVQYWYMVQTFYVCNCLCELYNNDSDQS